MSDLNPDVTAAADVTAANDPHADPVLIYEASTGEEAEMIRATLAAAGIPTFQPGDTANPYFGAIDANVDSVWMHHLYVAPSNVEAARALLNTSAPTEEELIAEAEADPTTLEEAEARARNA
ncbi:MAG: putative prokaryotic signal transducing protein [Chthonomonadaceae bacterium]|nr:putative prokaryotic signal transducing protein [Chthonomonadaceae bacterium]